MSEKMPPRVPYGTPPEKVAKALLRRIAPRGVRDDPPPAQKRGKG